MLPVLLKTLLWWRWCGDVVAVVGVPDRPASVSDVELPAAMTLVDGVGGGGGSVAVATNGSRLRVAHTIAGRTHRTKSE